MARTYNLQDIFARNLKERRRKLALTQAQLARKIGVSTSFVTEIETSRKAPSFAYKLKQDINHIIDVNIRETR